MAAAMAGGGAGLSGGTVGAYHMGGSVNAHIVLSLELWLTHTLGNLSAPRRRSLAAPPEGSRQGLAPGGSRRRGSRRGSLRRRAPGAHVAAGSRRGLAPPQGAGGSLRRRVSPGARVAVGSRRGLAPPQVRCQIWFLPYAARFDLLYDRLFTWTQLLKNGKYVF
ncbi:hypothetical protein GUJ93_ZPchr0006g42457 [Zizania palustris]|uniref:Uncharacterized protein n=1 Tax=Zizania palustris TaxID=103762 RepID=A0A8J5ST10_ZIZPA|nr:hypothetical protein GUJ93_ZPchr0006g42457 [Zizania palustris]